MTVPTTASSVTYIGNGSTTSFTFSFIGVSASDIEVIYTNSSGSESVLDPTQYTLVLNAPTVGSLWGIGGTVTYPITGTAIQNPSQITINRIVPYTQTVSIANQGAFYPQAVEQGLDLIELQLQQINTEQTYSLKTPITDASPPQLLPPAAERANGFLAFDATGEPIVLPGAGVNGGVVSVAMTVPSALLSISGSPVTTSGTLAVTLPTQNPNAVFAGPISGTNAAPTFRSLIFSDIPVATTSLRGAVVPDDQTVVISSGVISVAPATPRIVTVTGTFTSTLTTADEYKGISLYQSGAAVTTVQLPTSGSPYPVFDASGNSATFPITVKPPTGLLINGASTYTMNTNFGNKSFFNDTTQILVK